MTNLSREISHSSIKNFPAHKCQGSPLVPQFLETCFYLVETRPKILRELFLHLRSFPTWGLDRGLEISVSREVLIEVWGLPRSLLWNQVLLQFWEILVWIHENSVFCDSECSAWSPLFSSRLARVSKLPDSLWPRTSLDQPGHLYFRG